MYTEASQFHDHSTFRGKLSMIISRLDWKYVPGAAILTGLVVAGLLVAASSKDNPPSDLTSPASGGNLQSASPLRLSATPGAPQYPQVGPPGILRRAPETPFAKNAWDTTKISPPGVFESEGCQDGLMNFEGFPTTVNKASIKTLKLRDLIIDAGKLTRDLQNGWINLESIVIENAWISGDFERVYLPKLTKFIYHQFHNDKTDTYKLPQKLKSILFFDKIQGQTWDLEKDLLNLNMTIQVTIGGTKLLQIEPEFGDILINTHYCEDFLKNIKSVFPVSAVSLHWCPVTNASIPMIPRNIKALQLNNAVLSNDDLAMVVNNLRELTELHTFLRFHCEWPGYEIFLNVSSFPESLQTLSVTNLDISFSPEMPSPVKKLSFGSYVTPNLIPNFCSVFPNVTSVALFNVTADQAYPLLQEVIKTHVENIIVTNLTRIEDPMSASATNSERVVEWFLTNAGVPKGQPCFIVECKNGNYTGRALTDFEKNFYRFTRLGFDTLETYEDYMIWDAIPK